MPKELENHRIEPFKLLDSEERAGLMKVICAIKRMYGYRHDKEKQYYLNEFLDALNTKVYNYLMPGRFQPVFNSIPRMHRLIIAAYVIWEDRKFFSDILDDIFVDGGYDLGSTVGIIHDERGIKNTLEQWEKHFCHKAFFNNKLDEFLLQFRMKRHNRLGNPRKHDPTWLELANFLVSTRAIEKRYVRLVEDRIRNHDDYLMLGEYKVPDLLQIIVYDIQTDPLIAYGIFKPLAEEDESHDGEPGDWYLAPHPEVEIRDKLYCMINGITEPVDNRPIEEQLQELSEKYSPAKAKEEYSK